MDRSYPTLYARDSKGKILQWKTKVIREGEQVHIQKSYGELNGGQIIRWQRNIKGVNEGKSNETNPFEQACLQCESTIRRQKDKGYMDYDDLYKMHPNIDIGTFTEKLDQLLPKTRLDASGNVKPMKAQQYYRSKKNWTDPVGKVWEDRKYYYLKNPNVPKEPKAVIPTFPVMAQPKINGVRATIQIAGKDINLLSKEGKAYNIPHVNDFVNMNLDMLEFKGEDLILDGELYIHGESLQTISSAIKAQNLDTQRVKFILFDLAIEGHTNIERWNIIKSYIKPIVEQNLNCPIEIIRTFNVPNDTDAQIVTDRFIKEGYEGTIFRDRQGEYAFGKRPMTMTKLKRVIDEEFTITDVIPQDVDPSKGLYVCTTSEGNIFKVNPKGTDQFKQYVLENKEDIIGKQLTCTFYEWTDAGLPFHVIDNIIRDYE